MSAILHQISAVFYALVGCIGLGQLSTKLDDDVRLVLIPLWVSLSVHGLAIGARALELGAFPFVGLSDGLSLFGFGAALLALMLSRRRYIPQVAVAATVLAASLVVLAEWASVPRSDSIRLRQTWLQLHIAFIFLGMATFALAGIVSTLYLIKDGRLKTKTARTIGGALGQLPSLELLDRLTLRFLKVGFPMMGVGLICGAIHSELSIGRFWTWNALGTLGVLVWVMYGLLIQLRATIGWRGRKAAWLTVAGVVAILLPLLLRTLFGVGPHGGT